MKKFEIFEKKKIFEKLKKFWKIKFFLKNLKIFEKKIFLVRMSDNSKKNVFFQKFLKFKKLEISNFKSSKKFEFFNKDYTEWDWSCQDHENDLRIV